MRCAALQVQQRIGGSQMKSPLSAAILAASLSASIGLISTRSLADERCQQLEVLRAQYAGVELTSGPKADKEGTVGGVLRASFIADTMRLVQTEPVQLLPSTSALGLAADAGKTS